MKVKEKVSLRKSYDKVCKSPLGLYLVPIIDKSAKLMKKTASFSDISNNLANNSYENYEKLLEDIKNVINYVIQFHGKTSKVGLACQTFIQIFEEEFEQYKDMNIPTEQELKEKMINAKNIIDQIKEEIPNSMEEINNTKNVHVRLQKLPFTEKTRSNLLITDDNQSELVNDLNDIETDERIQDVAALATVYDKTITVKRSTMTIKINETSPFLLSLIRQYIDTKAADIESTR